jgi:MinD superfamily P-loop ATPase
MSPQRKVTRRILAPDLSPLDCPACTSCGRGTRFVGLESISGNDRDDLCTYQCNSCGHCQASLMPRVNGRAYKW